MDDTHFNVPPAKASRVLPVTRRVNDAWEVKPAAPVLPPTPYFLTPPVAYGALATIT